MLCVGIRSYIIITYKTGVRGIERKIGAGEREKETEGVTERER